MACGAPHAHALALLCVVSRLLVACPRISTMLEPTEVGGAMLASPLDDVEVDDPDATLALRSTAWHLVLLQAHYHPTVRDLAAKLAAQVIS
jgi:hypothetical protein